MLVGSLLVSYRRCGGQTRAPVIEIVKYRRRDCMGILILALLIVMVVAIFTIQNALPVSIVFLFWKFQASLAIVTFLSVLTGIVIASIIFFWLRIRCNRKEKNTSLPA
ncbi:MAG: hypothetical protein C0399_01650 [Syntrophus sp. (in: bacteria)]|nr:hypothetical protein [Syntrophus sp. (in: bacteria)]